jgi:hypothetical protein
VQEGGEDAEAALGLHIPGVSLIKLFYSSQTLKQNKLECLYTGEIFWLAFYLPVRLEPIL